MNNNNNNNTVKELLFIGALISLLFVSCMAISWIFDPKSNRTYHQTRRHVPFRHVHFKPAQNSAKTKKSHKVRPLPRQKLVSAMILEDRTVTYCTLSAIDQKTVKPLDTVWLNVYTHRIDDTAANTMKAVLYSARF